LAIELIDSVLQLIIPLQDYEPNPSGPTCFVIDHDLGRLDWVSVRFKPIVKIGIGNLERQVSDEQLGHGFLPGHFLRANESTMTQTECGTVRRYEMFSNV
jgi:hypothetical protein